MAKQLRIDFEELSGTIAAYKEIVDEFQLVKEQANNAMKALEESKWRSAASEAYFRTYSDNWVKAFNDHILSLNFLIDQLENAQGKYSDLYDEIDEIAAAVRAAS
ncbi:MAG: WXG100 family type VII secretion target [Clostridia bacterium]|nr:WXG100 family type VII secretion target [Clostridia bacterium]